MRLNLKLRFAIPFAILISIGALIGSSNSANAAPACNPTYVGIGNGDYVRNFIFSSVGTCTWTVPSGMYVEGVLVVGGGGGGGGGSWAGTNTGGGGGGGGSGGILRPAVPFLYKASSFDITIGAGGSAGAGAGASTNLGGNGGDGEQTTFASFAAEGGQGGRGGGSDVGGSGGRSGFYVVSSQVYQGGSQANGNGGGGSSGFVSGGGRDADSNGGTGYAGSAYLSNIFTQVSGSFFLPSGSGGASSGNSSVNGGTSSQSPATTIANTGGGGHGGHGCPQTEVTCANSNGSAGASGYVVVAVKWALVKNSGSSTRTGIVGEALTDTPFDGPPPFGTGSWAIANPLPGLNFNSATGELTGSPTMAGGPYFAEVSFTDSAIPNAAIKGSMQYYIRVGLQKLVVPRQTLEYGKTFRIPIEGFGGSGGISTSKTTGDSICSESGPNRETITALASSGTCAYRVFKALSANYGSGYVDVFLDLVKVNTQINISTTVGSGIEVGTPIPLTATLSSGATGTVKFYIQGSEIESCGTNGSVTVVSNQATCTWTPTSASDGALDIGARYFGSTNFQPASTDEGQLLLNVYPSIYLEYFPISMIYQSSEIAYHFVDGGTGAYSDWTWSVKKTSDNSSVPGITIDNVGYVTIDSTVPSGTYDMTVRATDTATITTTANLMIYVSPSTPDLWIEEPDYFTYVQGQTVNLTATLPSNASGTVTFKYNNQTITSCGTSGAVTVTSGSALCSWTTSAPLEGLVEISASYSGGGSYNATTLIAGELEIVKPASYSYNNESFVYGEGGSIYTYVDYGSGESSDWDWSIVKTSDSSTVSGITIDSGVISISPTLAAGSYAMTVTTVDRSDDTRTATVLITINKAQPVITISPRVMMLTSPVPEATAGRQIFWKIETTHRSAGTVAMFVNGSDINCMTSIQYQDGQCYWSSSTANSTVSAYATFAGDSNLETATSNVITGFKVNAALSLAYSDTSTYSGVEAYLSPIASGGTGSRTYQMFQYPLGDQVFGISIETSTGVILVSRSVVPGVYRMQVRADDITGANAQDDNVQITVTAQQSPAFTLNRTSETVNKNSTVSGYSIAHSSTPGFIYSISPALPSGLNFSTVTGEIYGAPTVAQSATAYTITAVNNAGSETATFTLAVSENLIATISVSVGTNPAAKGTANTIVATISAAGKVQFYIDGKRVPGCVSVRGTTSVTCNWKPALSGKVTVQAKLTPTNGSIPAVTSTPLQVSIGRRTGLRG